MAGRQMSWPDGFGSASKCLIRQLGSVKGDKKQLRRKEEGKRIIWQAAK